MQWAKIFSSKKVVVFDISEERLDLAMRMGADAVINTTKENYMEEAMAITGKGHEYASLKQPTGVPCIWHLNSAVNKAHMPLNTSCRSYIKKQWENMNRKEFKLTGSWMSYSSPFPGKEGSYSLLAFATGQLKFDPGIYLSQNANESGSRKHSTYKTPVFAKGRFF